MKRALVTGGSGGIGTAVCERLAQQGHHVVVHAHAQADKAQALAQRIVQAGGSASAVVFDVSDRAASAQALPRPARNSAEEGDRRLAFPIAARASSALSIRR